MNETEFHHQEVDDVQWTFQAILSVFIAAASLLFLLWLSLLVQQKEKSNDADVDDDEEIRIETDSKDSRVQWFLGKSLRVCSFTA